MARRVQKSVRNEIAVENMNANPTKVGVVEAGEASFEAEVLKVKLPVLVEFAAAWSRPCQVLDLVLNEVANACATRAKVVRVNADDNPDLSLWFGIQSIPTLLYFLGGKVQDRIVGTASKEAILSKLQAIAKGGDAHSPTALHINQHENSGSKHEA